MTTIELRVNGRAVSESVEPRTHLADLLRDRMDLTGTHLRCEHGVCGVCTLLIDGQLARACITYAVLCQGADITTIEGLEDDSIIVALRRAFTAEHGLQCGFCTPAMLITARDIILRLPDADEARVRIELSGNLCRCTGYVGIVRAVLHALREIRNADAVPAGPPELALGPVGARPAQSPAMRPELDPVRSSSLANTATLAASAVPESEADPRGADLCDNRNLMTRVRTLLAQVFGRSHR
jgi:aerobic carbon-monoxide dehydrogenase small subunit